MKITIKETDPLLKKKLDSYKPAIQRIFLKLYKLYPEIKLPKHLTVKHLREHNRRCMVNLTLARAGRTYKGEWYIALRKTLNGRRYIKDILCHEVAHIGEALMTKKWGHSKLWEEIYKRLNYRGSVGLGELMISIVVWFWLIWGVLKLFKWLF